MEILKVQNLCKTYGTGEAKVDALKNVSFSLEKVSSLLSLESLALGRVPC